MFWSVLEFSYHDSDGLKWTTKRPKSRVSISKTTYRPCSNVAAKPPQNHFVKYSDLKLKGMIHVRFTLKIKYKYLNIFVVV